MLIQNLTLIGVGLIGGSLARALKQAEQCGHIIGCGRNVENLQTAVRLGVIDAYETELAQAVANADVVVVATPLGAMDATLQAIAPALKTSAIVTDVGSAKQSVAQAAYRHLSQHLQNMVPAHPIAGAEQSGVLAAKVDLFQQRRVIITPLAETSDAAKHTITRMWQLTGAEVIDLPIDYHDQVLAATSHLPHMLAYALVDLLASMETGEDIFRFAAGGFKDFTRIASSDPTMWHDICVANRNALVVMLKRFQQHLAKLTTDIEQQHDGEFKALFQRAKTARDQFNLP
jgi:prephenate dehydrogenase